MLHAFLIHRPVPSNRRCADGYELYNGKCWRFSTDEASWQGARYACAADNAELATISNGWQSYFVYSRTVGQGINVIYSSNMN